jgi:hypothetical protein
MSDVVAVAAVDGPVAMPFAVDRVVPAASANPVLAVAAVDAVVAPVARHRVLAASAAVRIAVETIAVAIVVQPVVAIVANENITPAAADQCVASAMAVMSIPRVITLVTEVVVLLMDSTPATERTHHIRAACTLMTTLSSENVAPVSSTLNCN